MNADGSDPVRLTNEAPFDGDPAWSADGTKLVFASVFGLQVMNADGTGRFSVTGNPFDAEPAWSPDGTKIAFTSDDPESAEIHVVNVDGSGEVNLTNDPADDFAPAWSPDGSKIAFTGLSSVGVQFHYDIYTMNPDGSGQTNLTPGLAAEQQPDWSPDGSKIAFSSFSSIGVMIADGSELRRLSPGFDGDPSRQPIPFPGRPPDCSGVTASPDVLLPPSRDTFRVITLSGAVDPDGDPTTFSITRVTQDEPVTAPGDDTTPDARRLPAPDQLELRPERNPMRDGRVYRIRYTVLDGRGGSCRGTEPMSVPRHRDEPAIDSAPPSYDSFGP